MKSISIIIPTYNVESFIDSCLKSVFDSIDCELEVIIIDDSSIDDTVAKVDSWTQTCSNINFIKLDENVGQGAARNLALQLANNQYILFLDSDDLLTFDIMDVIDQVKDEDLVIFNHKLLWLGNSVSENPQSEILENLNFRNLRVTDIKPRSELLKNISVPWNKIYRKEFLKDNNIYFTDGIYEDIPFHWNVITKADAIKVVDIPAYLYRQREGSTLLSRSDKHSELVEQYKHVYASIEASYRTALDEVFIHHMAIVLLKKSQRLTDVAIMNIIKGTKDIISTYNVSKSYSQLSLKGKLLFMYLAFTPKLFLSEISKRFLRGGE